MVAALVYTWKGTLYNLCSVHACTEQTIRKQAAKIIAGLVGSVLTSDPFLARDICPVYLSRFVHFIVELLTIRSFRMVRAAVCLWLAQQRYIM